MAAPNNQSDPTGLAAIVIGALTPVVALAALVLHWSTDISNAVLLVVTGLVEGGVGVWAVLNARKHAYAPETVDELVRANRIEAGQVAERVRTGEHPIIPPTV